MLTVNDYDNFIRYLAIRNIFLMRMEMSDTGLYDEAYYDDLSPQEVKEVLEGYSEG